MKLAPEAYLQRMRSSSVYNVAVKTPLEEAPLLSSRLGRRVFLKREDLQPVFSFKLRGAFAAISRLSQEELSRGVIAASAGNHAQGVALAAQRLAIKSVIVVPTTTPEVKQAAIRALGARLITHGDSYDDAFAHAVEVGRREGLAFIHPYDDPDVIAGQGTIGLELHEQLPPNTEAVFVSVGGGGLISGVALALKQLRPGIQIIGAEPEDSDSIHRSLAAGRRVKLDRVGLFADGVAVKQVGEEPFAIARKFVDEVVVVSNDAICAAIKEVFEDRRAVLEPAGALAVAGMTAWLKGRPPGGPAAAIACGANINFDRLRHVAERAALGENLEVILAVKIPERPGSFRRLCSVLGGRAITEFNYRMGDAATATVFVGVQTKAQAEAPEILALLATEGFEAHDLSQNEMAKTHLRHMVGGRSSDAGRERIFHFDFPERPGALTQFLDVLGGRWNISLFHYRCHGSDRGRVLAGFQVPEGTGEDLAHALASLGYDAAEETDNPAVRLFL